MEFKIRNATLLDISSILDFAKHVGRYISADEVRTYLQVDPEAMFVAETDPGGKLIGSCCATRLTPELGYMGLYVVLQEYRGKGIGSKLWEAAKKHLEDRNIGVRGDPINFKKYSESDGFCYVEDYSIIYYECFGDSLPRSINLTTDFEVATYFEGCFNGSSKKLCISDSVTAEKKHLNEFEVTLKNPTAMENSRGEDILSGVVAFDKELHKRDRSLIVKQTFSWTSCRSKVVLQGSKVVGYACLRSVVTEHWLISPFYADTEGVAEILLFELLQVFDFSQAPKGIQIRFPDKNSACQRLAEKFGFKKISIRLLTGFTKECINVDTSKVYSFHSTVFSSE